MKNKLKPLFIILSIVASCFFLQSCLATSLKGMREGPIDNAIENGQLQIGMTWSEVTGLVGTPTVFCKVKNQSSSSGNKKIWITDATSQVWLHRYELVFTNNKLESWTQR